MHIITQLFLSIVVLGGNIFAMEMTLPDEQGDTYKIQKFLERNTIDNFPFFNQHRKELETHKDEILTALKENRRASFAWLPDCMIKKDIDRMQGAEKIETARQECNTAVVHVPSKCLYHIPGSSEDITIDPILRWFDAKNYLVLVEKKRFKDQDSLIFDKSMPMQLKALKDLYFIMKKTKYEDINTGNIVNDPLGNLYIIDTEMKSFSRASKKRYFHKAREDSDFVIALDKLLHRFSFERDAYEWLEDQIRSGRSIEE